MDRKQIESMIGRYCISETEDGRLRAGRPGNDIEIIKAAKDDIINYYKEIKQEREERVRKIEAIEGLKELEKARSEWRKYHYEFNRIMESGDSIFPARPEIDPDEIAKIYPRAAAYIKAESYASARNVDKYSAGKKALERIINGEDYEVVITEMESEWKAAALNAVMFN